MVYALGSTRFTQLLGAHGTALVPTAVLAEMRSGDTGRLPHDAPPPLDEAMELRTTARDGGTNGSMPTGPLGTLDDRLAPHRRRQRRAMALLRALEGARLYLAVRGAYRLLLESEGETNEARSGAALRGIEPQELMSLLEELRPLALGMEDRRVLREILAGDPTACGTLARSLVVAGYTFRGDPLLARLWGDLPVIDDQRVVEAALANRRIRALLEPFGLDSAVRRSRVPFWFVDSAWGEFLFNARRGAYEAQAKVAGVPFRVGLRPSLESFSVTVQYGKAFPYGAIPRVMVNGEPLRIEPTASGRSEGIASFGGRDPVAVRVLRRRGKHVGSVALVALLHRGTLTTRP